MRLIREQREGSQGFGTLPLTQGYKEEGPSSSSGPWGFRKQLSKSRNTEPQGKPRAPRSQTHPQVSVGNSLSSLSSALTVLPLPAPITSWSQSSLAYPPK